MLDTKNLPLAFGSHKTPEEGMCLLETIASLAEEPHSDHPKCACPVVSSFGRILNDRMGKGAKGDALRAKYIAPLATKLVGTRSTPEVEKKRAFFFVDQAVRFFAPSALEAAGFTEEAKTLRSLPKIVDEHTATVARDAAHVARDAAVDVAWAASAADHAASASAEAAASASKASEAAVARWAATWAASASADAAWYAATRWAATWAAEAAAWAADDAAYYARPTAARPTVDAARAAAHAAARTAAADAAWEQAAKALKDACEIGLKEVNDA